jgi:hypothetical protein
MVQAMPAMDHRTPGASGSCGGHESGIPALPGRQAQFRATAANRSSRSRVVPGNIMIWIGTDAGCSIAGSFDGVYLQSISVSPGS